jgi:hypothetical protein
MEANCNQGLQAFSQTLPQVGVSLLPYAQFQVECQGYQQH